MAQPFDIQGRIEVPSTATDKLQSVRDGLERRLTEEPLILQPWDGSCLRFDGRPWFQLWLLGEDGRALSRIRHGEIQVSSDEAKVIVEYRFTFRLVGSSRDYDWFFEVATMRSLTEGAKKEIQELQAGRM